MVVVPHPLYSSDLATRDFTLFSKMKLKLTRDSFDAINEIQMKLQVILNKFQEKDFCGAFEA